MDLTHEKAPEMLRAVPGSVRGRASAASPGFCILLLAGASAFGVLAMVIALPIGISVTAQLRQKYGTVPKATYGVLLVLLFVLHGLAAYLKSQHMP